MKYNPDIHHRKSIRLKGYDYSNAGMYFLTICTYNRESVFCDFVGAGSPCPRPVTSPNIHSTSAIDNNESSIFEVNKYGQIIQQYWGDISNHFQNVNLDEFVIMPNHIHGIIKINAYTGQGGETNQQENQLGREDPAPTKIPTLGQIIGYFKYQTTKTINQIDNTSGRPIWQRNYYEQIIRTEADYFKITQYIKDNPQNWYSDTENPCRGKVSLPSRN